MAIRAEPVITHQSEKHVPVVLHLSLVRGKVYLSFPSFTLPHQGPLDADIYPILQFYLVHSQHLPVTPFQLQNPRILPSCGQSFTVYVIGKRQQRKRTRSVSELLGNQDLPKAQGKGSRSHRDGPALNDRHDALLVLPYSLLLYFTLLYYTLARFESLESPDLLLLFLPYSALFLIPHSFHSN